tara:strand:+ start:320 stop:529 length:210 start_codon:yes stop_codon:yes gene_type:complete
MNSHYISVEKYDSNVDEAWKLLLDYRIKSDNEKFLDDTAQIMMTLRNNLNNLYYHISKELERLEEVQDA